jgi:hypothetical protein
MPEIAFAPRGAAASHRLRNECAGCGLKRARAEFDPMRNIFANILGCVVVASAIALMTAPAEAKGCIKGAMVGGVAGHVAGHHGFLGAAAGCVIGHHEANRHAKKNQSQNQPQ